MAYYAAPGSQVVVSTTYKTATALWMPASTSVTGTVRKPKVFEIMVGAIANPNATDTFVQCDVSRITATATYAGTAGVFSPLDVNEPLPTTTGLTNCTAEGTITGPVTLWNIGMNQRATVRWIAAQESQYLVAALASGTGFALRMLSTQYAGSFDGQLSFME